MIVVEETVAVRKFEGTFRLKRMRVDDYVCMLLYIGWCNEPSTLVLTFSNISYLLYSSNLDVVLGALNTNRAKHCIFI